MLGTGVAPGCRCGDRVWEGGAHGHAVPCGPEALLWPVCKAKPRYFSEAGLVGSCLVGDQSKPPPAFVQQVWSLTRCFSAVPYVFTLTMFNERSPGSLIKTPHLHLDIACIPIACSLQDSHDRRFEVDENCQQLIGF